MTHLHKPDAAPKEEHQACPQCNATRKVVGTVVLECDECGEEAFDMADMPYFRLRAAIFPLLTEIKEMRDGLPQDCAADLQIISGWDALIGPVEEALKP